MVHPFQGSLKLHSGEPDEMDFVGLIITSTGSSTTPWSMVCVKILILGGQPVVSGSFWRVFLLSNT